MVKCAIFFLNWISSVGGGGGIGGRGWGRGSGAGAGGVVGRLEVYYSVSYSR